MKVIIDRFEGDFAVCEQEDKKMVNIDRSKLPEQSAEGDVLDISSGTIRIDRNETNERKKKISNMMDNLWK
jgi:hypothetical protein